jgi:hypothetical protein
MAEEAGKTTVVEWPFYLGAERKEAFLDAASALL